MNPPLKQFPVILKSILMFSLLMVFMSVVSYFGYLSLHGLFGVEKPEKVVEGVFTGANDIKAFLFYQAITSLGSFLLTAYLFSALESGKPLEHLRLKSPVGIKFIVLGIFAMVAAQFFIEFLVEVNSKLPFPASVVDEYQKKIAAITNALMDFKDVPRLLFTTFVLAIVPAFAEEFFFRGLFLGDMLKNKVNPVFAIALSGLFFALAHFEFNNTLAIWVLGSFLGYLYYVSGSLWVPIAAHFTNNFLTVLLKYLFNIGVISTDFAEAATPWYLTLTSMLLFSGCIYLFYKWRIAPSFEEPEVEMVSDNELPDS